jgi:WhiB family redox-sensing transcriptional regulator
VRGGLTEQEREHLHDTLPRRRDWTRVNEAIAGRDIHLTKAEREAIVLVAHQDTIPAERLAHILKVSRGHAMKLLRAVRRAAEHAASTAPDRTGFEQAA